MLLIALFGCGGGGGGQAGNPLIGQIAPDFNLTDVNQNSASYNQAASPRNYLTKASAWYFGHST
jgi:hypothetical protein